MPVYNETQFDNELKFNPQALGEAWDRHAGLYHKYGRLQVQAVAARDEAKLDLDLIATDIDAEVRAKAKRLEGSRKPSETRIRSMIQNDKRHEKAKRALLDAELDVNYLTMALRTLEHRKTALEFRTRLRLSEWNSEPRQIATSGSDMAERQRQQAQLSGERRVPVRTVPPTPPRRLQAARR